MQDKNIKILIFGSVFIIIGFLQRIYIERAGHFVPTFDTIDAFFFGLGFIGFVLGGLRFLSRKK